MLNIITPPPPTKFAKTVTRYSGNIPGRAFKGFGECNPPIQIPGKSYDLGAYPRNVVGDWDFDITQEILDA